MAKPSIIVIVGQTASGKSDLAVRLAKAVRGEVISADSRQVYKGLDIGTGKITQKEMQGIPHHLLSIASPRRKFTVVDFQKLATQKIKEIIQRNKIPIIVGGTGFYVDSLTKGEIYPQVKRNTDLRRRLNKKTTEEVFDQLKKLDPKRAKNIDSKNKVRLIRAIEIATELGKVPKIKKVMPKYRFIKIGLELTEKIHKTKISNRVEKMFKDGLLSEIKKLKKVGISEKRLKEFGFEYNEPNIDKVIRETVKYAKRQKTWFKRDQEIKWFKADESGKAIAYTKRNL